MATSAGGSVAVPYFQPDEQRHRRKIAEWTKAANSGHIPVTGTVTLTASSGTTTVEDQRCGPMSHVSLTPTTAKGLSAAPTVYVSAYNTGSFVLTHHNSATTTKTFSYSILGA